MEAAGQPHLDRQLGVEVLVDLLARLEQLLIEPGAGALLRNVGQQVGHFGLVRQLAQHGAERTAPFPPAAPCRRRGSRPCVAFCSSVASSDCFFGARGVELRLLRLPRQEVDARQIAAIRKMMPIAPKRNGAGQRPGSFGSRSRICSMKLLIAALLAIAATCCIRVRSDSCGFSWSRVSVNQSRRRRRPWFPGCRATDRPATRNHRYCACRKHARARLRDALELDLAIGLLDRGQVDAIRQRAHELIEHVHDFRPAALELLDDLHAREQALLLCWSRSRISAICLSSLAISSFRY